MTWTIEPAPVNDSRQVPGACPSCSYPLDVRTGLCVRCVAARLDANLCPRCGAEQDPDFFCFECGLTWIPRRG